MTPRFATLISSAAALALACLPFSLAAQEEPATPESVPIAQHSPDSWVINFKDSDIQSVIRQIAEITNDNFIIPPTVTGKVNVISQTPLKKDEVRELLLSVLYINGFTVTPSGSALVIQASGDARKNKSAMDKSGKISGETFVTRVLPVKFANVNDLMQAVQPLVSDFAVLKGLPDSNALLVADKADNVQKVAQIVAQLDYAETDQVETIKLANSWVGSVMPMLEKLAPRELGASGKPATSPIRVVGNEHNNTIMLKGDREARNRLRTLIAQLDQGTSDGTTVQVIPLRNADATKTAETLKDMFTNSVAAAASPNAIPVSIKASPSTNALVVHAAPDVVNEIRKVLVQLDVQRPQVLIEAAIVEINDEFLNQLGIQFGAGQSGFEAGLLTSSLSAGAAGALAVPSTPLATFLQGIGSPNSGLLGGGLTGAIGSHSKFSALVQALAADSHAKLLSTPSITTVNNEDAKIVVGQNVPFRTGSFETSANSTGNPFTTIQRQDVGVTLKVTPQIHENNSVMLKVEQEVSTVAPTTVAGAADIITNKRTINTTVLATNGQTVALGGLISDDKTTAKTKVPLLGDIPIVGLLFQSNQLDNTKSDLVVFLRPTIINDNDDIEGINLRKYNGIWELDLGPKADEHPLTADMMGEQTDKLYTPDFSKQEKPIFPWLASPSR